jgi:dTMP kinase
MGGLFITFEGIEGTGKTTQIGMLAEELRSAGRQVVSLREPGGTSLGNVIRGLLLGQEGPKFGDLTEAYLFATSRAELVQRVVLPALAEGKMVLCDRFVDSSVVYQGMARGLGRERVLAINDAAVQGCWPDLTVVLDLPADEGLARVRSRSLFDRIENEEIGFHQKVRDGFLELAEAQPRRYAVVDASPTRMTVHRSVVAALRARFEEVTR